MIPVWCNLYTSWPFRIAYICTLYACAAKFPELLYCFIFMFTTNFISISWRKNKAYYSDLKKSDSYQRWRKQAKWCSVLYWVSHESEDNKASKESDQLQLKILSQSHYTRYSPNSAAVNAMTESNGTLTTKTPTVWLILCLLG